mgnify:CR=1 FL=1
MARQIINNIPADSGNGDSLKVAFDKVNANFAEVYSAVTATTVTKTSDLTNDGADGTHPFISTNDSIAFSAVTSLQSTIDDLQSQIDTLNDTISDLNADIVTQASTISTLSGIINTQNGQIAVMQADIADLYNIVNNL